MAISTELRKRTATFGGTRFPMPDKHHAELALEDLPAAKNISSAQKDAVKARAIRMLAIKKITG